MDKDTRKKEEEKTIDVIKGIFHLIPSIILLGILLNKKNNLKKMNS